MRLEWKVFISSKPCRLIVVPRQEFIKHMFGKLLFFFVFPKLGISYKAKKDTSLKFSFRKMSLLVQILECIRTTINVHGSIIPYYSFKICCTFVAVA